jgi:hypothetical protein
VKRKSPVPSLHVEREHGAFMMGESPGHRATGAVMSHYPISTGPLDATNNKIKSMQRQAYGFRDQVFFTLKIYALHLSTYALVG